MKIAFYPLKARHPERWSRLFYWMLCAASVFLIGGVRIATGQGPAPCTTLDDCSAITGLPAASECEEDSCTCSQKVECYVRNQDPLNNWPVVPGGQLQLNHNFFHDRFVETRISPDSYADWVRFTDPANGPANFPDGTVVYKTGYLPSDGDYSKPESSPGVGYIIAKIKGYCPAGSTVANSCLGGDWFSTEVAYKDYGTVLRKGQLVKFGKERGCFVCHTSASADADWLWKLHSVRKYR